MVSIVDGEGRQRAAGWLRTLRATGEYVYSSCYSTRTLPGAVRPSVHVVFPLEAGNVQVFLRPTVLPGGALELSSPAGAFGEDGAYVLVEGRTQTHAARAPIHETFRVYVDAEGVLRTNHILRLWSSTVVRLHYKLTPSRSEDFALSRSSLRQTQRSTCPMCQGATRSAGRATEPEQGVPHPV